MSTLVQPLPPHACVSVQTHLKIQISAPKSVKLLSEESHCPKNVCTGRPRDGRCLLWTAPKLKKYWYAIIEKFECVKLE